VGVSRENSRMHSTETGSGDDRGWGARGGGYWEKGEGIRKLGGSKKVKSESINFIQKKEMGEKKAGRSASKSRALYYQRKMFLYGKVKGGGVVTKKKPRLGLVLEKTSAGGRNF